MSLQVPHLKKDFPIFNNYAKTWGHELTFLDSAASSQTPSPVLEAMHAYYVHHRSNVHRSSYRMGTEATQQYEQARETVAQFIGAEKWEVVFTGGATMSMNMLTHALDRLLPWSDGDEIVTSIAEHHSNFLPLQELARSRGITLKVIPLRGTQLGTEDVEWSPRVKIVSVSLASNVLGTVFDVTELLASAKKAGAITIVDATALVGHRPLHVRDLDYDFMYFSGHKMLGPTGIGILYGREEALAKLPPAFVGGGIIEEVTVAETKYLDIPERFEAGTPNIAGALGLARAAEYLQGIGTSAIREHMENLVEYASRALKTIPGLRVLSEEDARKNCGIVSFVLEDIHAQDIARFLDGEHIAIRAGHHCAMPLRVQLEVPSICRASFHIYNDRSDIDSLVEGVNKARKVL